MVKGPSKAIRRHSGCGRRFDVAHSCRATASIRREPESTFPASYRKRMPPDNSTTVATRNALFTPTRCFGLVAFVIPLLTLYAPLSLAVVLPFGVLLAVVCRWTTGRPSFQTQPVPWIPVVALVAIAAASALWSYAPAETLGKLPRTAMATALGIAFVTALAGLTERERNAVSTCLAAGFAVAVAAVLIERLTGGLLLPFRDMEADPIRFLNQFNRPLSILSILIWPVAVRLAQWRATYAIVAVAAFFAMLFAFLTAAASAAVVLGAVAGALVYLAPRTAGLLVGGVLALFVVLAHSIDNTLPPPKELYTSLDLPRSSYHRLIIWDFAAGRISERPLLGWGFNTSRAIPGGDVMVDVTEDALPLHPHNAALQWRLELGILGALLGAGIVLAATESARRHARGRLERAGAIATIVAAFTIAMLSFGIWQSWWVSALFLAAGFTVLACGRGRTPEN